MRTHKTDPTEKRQIQFPTLTALAGFLDVSVGELRAIKKAGCPGFFANGRVSLREVAAWLVSGGKPKQGLSLEDARARLADVQATRIQKQEALATGELVPAMWAADLITEHLSWATVSLHSRIDWMARVIGLSAGVTDERAREADVRRLLKSDTEQILNTWQHVRDKITDDLRKGPPEGPGQSAYGEFCSCFEELAKLVSDSARAELQTALEKIEVERGEVTE